MNTILKTNLSREIRQHFQLFALAAFSVGLLLIRAKMTQSIYFFFLIWNLFLAYTPLAVSSVIIRYKILRYNWYYSYPILFCWLLLLPNAPYLITDFIHLRAATPVPVWFDVLILASFTLTGLLFGLASMQNIYRLLAIKFGSGYANLTLLIVSILSAFGIYLGRFMRYNSWDILHKPISLITDIIQSLFSEDTWKPAWGITIGFGLLQYLLFDLYSSMKR
ncbi:DUF1361 domain-containing protein [Flavobacterium psychrotrophum]|uniref:DUF1361 domain-containing protein n=1 Tax=Flavobacterium psychrotrophum TaxID=2294119 RepID=UPI000E31BF55|nr:DUF1361 domain-containing protein [Flavobacterium psychrotrophum]